MSTSRPRLVSRRGSNAAPDPFNVHADVNLNPNRTSSSTLTIVRVPSTPSAPSEPHQPSSPVHSHRKSLHYRKISLPSSTTTESPGRLSFAFSSFSGPNQRPSSPTSSPSSSPRLSASSFSSKPRLTPDRLVDLARQATNCSGSTLSGATFTPLPDDVYLPFLHRPSEVAAIIFQPPDAKLFTLLAQTFPVNQKENDSSSLPSDPTCWTYAQLICHLTQIDRDLAPDFVWAVAARKCIFSHSELIWERVKGALGIPPELDMDVQFLDDDEESPPASPHELTDTEQVCHWDSAVLDSPVLSKAVDVDEIAHSGNSDADHITIEPLIAPSSGTLTQGDGLGLGNIEEDVEEEFEDIQNPDQHRKEEDKEQDSIDPSNIQGLRITTSSLLFKSTPTPPHTSIDTPSSFTLASGLADISIRNREQHTHSRSSSFSSIGIGPFQRSESTGALSALWKSGSDGGDRDSAVSVSGYMSDGERVPGGGPLFPSNFARLGLASRGSPLPGM